MRVVRRLAGRAVGSVGRRAVRGVGPAPGRIAELVAPTRGADPLGTPVRAVRVAVHTTLAPAVVGEFVGELPEVVGDFLSGQLPFDFEFSHDLPERSERNPYDACTCRDQSRDGPYRERLPTAVQTASAPRTRAGTSGRTRKASR